MDSVAFLRSGSLHCYSNEPGKAHTPAFTETRSWNILEIQEPTEFFMSIKQETQTIPHQFYYCVSSLTE